MTPQQAQQKIKEKLAELARFRREDVPHIIGNEAVRHYNESFVNEGKTDESLEKWQEVKRRNPDSPWYGFSYGAKSPRPGADPKSKAKATNFSPTRTRDKVLTGESNELKNATDYIVMPDRVVVQNDKPYARVHNFGENAKIFGKKTFKMPARPFIYESAALNRKIAEKIKKGIKKIVEQ
jgi:phage gpG-like protein